MSETTHRDHHTRADLEAIDGEPVTLNCGCGLDETGVGIDINYTPDIHHDLNEGIPVADDAADRVLATHVLEHLDNPTRFLAECRRVLRDDGTLELEVPNVAWLPVRLWVTQDLQRFWSHKDPDQRGHWLARRLGNEDDRRTAHRTLWTKQLLAEYLDRAGFAYDIDGWHGSRNLSVTATPDTGGGGHTLHELERVHGDDLASEDYWAQTRARIIEAWVRERSPDAVLDAGCGSGYLTAQLADALGCAVEGIDIAAESIAIAQDRETAATFRECDVRDIAGTYDVVIFADVLEHFSRPQEPLRAAAEAVGADGSVIVSLPAHAWLWGPHDEHNEHVRRYDAETLREVAADAGLRVARHRHTNAIPLLPYALYQRVLKRTVPDATRGGHGRLVERLKQAAIRAEVAIDPPVGVTLLAELEQA